MDRRNHPAVKKFNKTAEKIIAEADEAEKDPNYQLDPDYIMPSSMMQGTQIDASQLPPLPKD